MKFRKDIKHTFDIKNLLAVEVSDMEVHRCRFVDYTPHTITSLAFSYPSTAKFAPNDLRLAVGRNNGDVEIWNPKNKWVHELTLYGAKEQSVEGLVWCSPEGESPRLFSIGGTTKLTEWDLKTGKVLLEYDCNAAIIWSLAKNESQDKIAVGCDDGTVVVVDISGGVGSIEHYAFLQRQDARVLSLCWKGDSHVIGGCADGKVKVWSCSPSSKRLVSSMKVDKSKTESTLVWSVLYLPNKDQIVSGDSTGSVKFWEFSSFTLLQSFKVHEADILTITTDLNNNCVFTAGVDRKIFRFQNIEQQKSQKWVNLSNRLFHSNDIRSMATFESKNLNLLISGGVEKNIVVSSIKSFADGQYRKLSIIPQRKHVVMNRERKLVVMWQDQTVKIWRLLQKIVEVDSDEEMINGHEADDGVEQLKESFELVAKLTLSDEENITQCAISQDGTILAVGRLSTTKLFQLNEKQGTNGLKVSKINNSSINALGSSHLEFYGNDQLIMVTPENEIYKVSLESDDIVEYSLTDLAKSKSKLSYCENVTHIAITHSKLIVCRSGALDVVELDNDLQLESMPFLRLSSYVVRISISQANKSVILITHENKIYEFDLQSSHLTSWSKANSEFLPREFLQLQESPLGMFNVGTRLWVYGSNWMSVFDMQMNVPMDKKETKKRSRAGVVIGHTEEDVESDEEPENENGDLEVSRAEIKNGKEGGIAYQLINKYKSILFAGNLTDDELIVVERPQFAIKQPPAFKLSQYRV